MCDEKDFEISHFTARVMVSFRAVTYRKFNTRIIRIFYNYQGIETSMRNFSEVVGERVLKSVQLGNDSLWKLMLDSCLFPTQNVKLILCGKLGV